MIRVNLARNRAGDSPGVQTQAMSMAPSVSPDNREMIVKIAVIVLPALALMFYESQNIRGLIAEQIRLQNEANELERQAQAKARDVELVKDVESQARELDDKLKILKTLSRLRLREVKTLDFVQNSIPEKVWLKSLSYEGDKDKVETGKFNFTGLAVSTEDLTDFVKRLEDSIYLSDVIVMKNQETTPTNTKVVLRDFQFTAQVEVHP